jgi:hypothetical protein
LPPALAGGKKIKTGLKALAKEKETNLTLT